MKKLLGIVVLGLLLNILNLNDTEANTLKIKNRVIKTQGDVFIKWPYKWKFSYDMEWWKPYMIQEVTDKVRLGDTALRFELRPESCGGTKGKAWDCNNNSERHELLPNNSERDITFNGNVWHTLSFYIVEFDTSQEGHNSVFQFHNDADWAPMFNWDITNDGLYTQRRTACNDPRVYKKYSAKGNDGCTILWKENANVKVMDKTELFNKWNDVVFNINYTTKDKGFLKMWINGKLVYHYQGPVKPPNKGGNWSNNSAMQFGIYRTSDDGWHNYTQVNYYDEIRYAKKKCKKLKLEELGYSCEKLESQKIKIDTIEEDNYLAVIKSKDDESYLLRVSGKTEKLAKKQGLKECKKAGNTKCYVHYSGIKPEY